MIIAGQLFYLPDRIALVGQLLAYTTTESQIDNQRAAYRPADYDLLAWVGQNTAPDNTLLLVTAAPATYGDASYVLYHRAIYHLSPRSVWWAAPVPASRYPAWWTPTSLTETNLLTIAGQRQATVILADGFSSPPLAGPSRSFDADTHLTFLNGSSSPPSPGERESLVTGHWSLAFFGLVGVAIFIWMWGDLLLGNATGLPAALRLASAWLIGGGLISWLMFLLLWAGLPLTPAVVSLSVGGSGVWMIVRGRHAVDFVVRSAYCVGQIRTTHHALRTTPHGGQSTLWIPSGWALLYLLLLLAQTTRVAWAAWVSPLTDWDGWVNWAGKANLLFIEQALTPNLYNNPARLPTNMDYPLMLPLLEAWGYTWLGHLSDPVVGLISFGFYLALLLLFYQAARRHVSPTTALGFTTLLATIPRLERPAHSGLADIPLAALILLAFLWLFYDYNGLGWLRQVGLLSLTGALLPWLKNEGWLWLGLISLVWLIRLGLETQCRRISPRQGLTRLSLYGFITLLIALPWPYFLATHGTVRFTFLPLTLANLGAHLPRWPHIIFEMSQRMLNPYWNFVWLFAGLTLLARGSRVFQAAASSGWLIWPVAGYLFLMSLTYVFSRFDPYLAHLNNSVERLLLQALPLALWWLIGQAVAAGWLTPGRDSEAIQE